MKMLEGKYDQISKESRSLGQKVDMAIELIKRILDWLKISRGKPGRHPKPFNVFVYHLINKCTKYKIDHSRTPVYFFRKDGQRKLERNWKLILFLILDTHLNVHPLPELEEFIFIHKKTPAPEALKILKKKLWNTYKNFPPLEGWPVVRKSFETGFRKLIAKDDGRLEIVTL